MPGTKTVNETKPVRAQYVKCTFSHEDEQTLLVNAGTFPAEYVPTSELSIAYESDDGQIRSGQIKATGSVAKAAILEFFANLPAGHALVRSILTGEAGYEDGDEVRGGSYARTALDGVQMDFHDGSGQFTVAADE